MLVDKGLFEDFREGSIQKAQKEDVIVVGAGIMGATIGRALRDKGRKVFILDADLPFSGTGACGGLVKPTPLTGLEKNQIKTALAQLDSVYGLTTVKMTIRPSRNILKADIFQVPMDKVFRTEKNYGKLIDLDLKSSPPKIIYQSKKGVWEKSCNLLILATGLGSRELFPHLFQKGMIYGKKGVSFIFSGTIEVPFVKIWAPYKQVTVHNFLYQGTPAIWTGDGSARLIENWDHLIPVAALKRIKTAMERNDNPIATIFGHRSFHKKRKPCYLEKIGNQTWIATGAGKFGCLAAGWAAGEIIKNELE